MHIFWVQCANRKVINFPDIGIGMELILYNFDLRNNTSLQILLNYEVRYTFSKLGIRLGTFY